MINFAHGEVFTLGAYLGWWVLALLLKEKIGGLHPAWVLPLMLGLAMAGSGLVGTALERFAYRPLYTRGATRLGPLISAVGASIFLQNAIMMGGILIYAFASATLGGITSPLGAVVGGFLVGVIENLAGTFIPFIGTELKLTVALLIIVSVLLIRPSGLFGHAVVRRV